VDESPLLLFAVSEPLTLLLFMINISLTIERCYHKIRKEGIEMAKHEDYELRTQQLLEPILSANHFELYDVEYVKEGGNWFLRAYIDKENGITVDDCELVSRALSDLLDKHDYISDSYILEVSSPGLGRQLKKDKHFEKSIGEEVELRLFKPINKQKDFTGILTGFDQESITLTLENEDTMVLKRSDIAMIRLTIDF
jgi:ribosome maturation factor RimP